MSAELLTVMQYLHHTKYPVIEPTEFDPTARDCCGHTYAMRWVIRNGTNPPEWSHHDPTIKDEAGETIAMYWIDIVKTNPPSWMWHHPAIRDSGILEATAALRWVMFVGTNPPEWMHHDPSMCFKFGRTLAMEWVRCNKTDPPEWMRHDPSLAYSGFTSFKKYQGNLTNESTGSTHRRNGYVTVNNKRETIAMCWVKHVKTEPPRWMQHDPTLKDIYGDTICSIWTKYVPDSPIPRWMTRFNMCVRWDAEIVYDD
jgi:hypothetical protein